MDVVVHKMFLFNFPFEDKTGVRLNLAAIPAEILEVFPTLLSSEQHSRALMQAHCSEVLGNVAVKIILALDDQMTVCEKITTVSASSSSSLSGQSSPLAFLRSPTKAVSSSSNAKESGRGRASLGTPPPLRMGYDASNDSSVSTLLDDQLSPVKGVTRDSSPEQLLEFHTDSTHGMDGGSKHAKVYRRGRVRKWMGDLCLQVCSPLDAIFHYSLSLTALRSTGVQLEGEEGSIIWQAWALEGIASGLLLAEQCDLSREDIEAAFKEAASLGNDSGSSRHKSPLQKLSGSPQPHEDVFVEEVPDVLMAAERRLEESMRMYGKRMYLLENKVAALLRLGALQVIKSNRAHRKGGQEERTNDDDIDADVAQDEDDAHMKVVVEARTRVLKCGMRAYVVASQSHLPIYHTCVEASLLCDRAQLHRKAAFFLLLARNEFMGKGQSIEEQSFNLRAVWLQCIFPPSTNLHDF